MELDKFTLRSVEASVGTNVKLTMLEEGVFPKNSKGMRRIGYRVLVEYDCCSLYYDLYGWIGDVKMSTILVEGIKDVKFLFDSLCERPFSKEHGDFILRNIIARYGHDYDCLEMPQGDIGLSHHMYNYLKLIEQSGFNISSFLEVYNTCLNYFSIITLEKLAKQSTEIG